MAEIRGFSLRFEKYDNHLISDLMYGNTEMEPTFFIETDEVILSSNGLLIGHLTFFLDIKKINLNVFRDNLELYLFLTMLILSLFYLSNSRYRYTIKYTKSRIEKITSLLEKGELKSIYSLKDTNNNQDEFQSVIENLIFELYTHMKKNSQIENALKEQRALTNQAENKFFMISNHP